MSQASSDLSDFEELPDYDALDDGNQDFAADAGDGTFDDGEYGDDVASGPIVRAPNYRKKGFSIYTVMLILSFVMLTTAAIMFFVQLGRY